MSISKTIPPSLKLLELPVSLLKLLVFGDLIFENVSYWGCLWSLCLGSILAGVPHACSLIEHLWNDRGSAGCE